MIKIGATYNETDFQYVCAESEDGIVSYEATGKLISKANNNLNHRYSCKKTIFDAITIWLYMHPI